MALAAPMMVHSQSLSALQKRAAKLEKQMKAVIKTADDVKEDTGKLQDQTELLKDQTDALDDEVGSIGETTHQVKQDVDKLKRNLAQVIRGDTDDNEGKGTKWAGTNMIFAYMASEPGLGSGYRGFRTEQIEISFTPSADDKNSGTFITSPLLFWRSATDVGMGYPNLWTGSYTVIGDMIYFYKIPPPNGSQEYWGGIAQGAVDGDKLIFYGRWGVNQTVTLQRVFGE